MEHNGARCGTYRHEAVAEDGKLDGVGRLPFVAADPPVVATRRELRSRMYIDEEIALGGDERTRARLDHNRRSSVHDDGGARHFVPVQ